MNCPVWVLGTKLKSSGREACAPNHWAVSLALSWYSFNNVVFKLPMPCILSFQPVINTITLWFCTLEAFLAHYTCHMYVSLGLATFQVLSAHMCKKLCRRVETRRRDMGHLMRPHAIFSPGKPHSVRFFHALCLDSLHAFLSSGPLVLSPGHHTPGKCFCTELPPAPITSLVN